MPGGRGVLLLGEPGAGKSDLTLRLIARGALLVADDRCGLFARDGALWAKPPAALAGLLEVRGAGIVQLPFAPEARLALAVRLTPGESPARLPELEVFAPPVGVASAKPLPLLSLDPFEASAPDKLAAAAAAVFLGLFRDSANSP